MGISDAQLLEWILKDSSGKPLITGCIGKVKAKIENNTATTSGLEICINDATTPTIPTPTPTTTTSTPEPVATVQQPVTEAVAAAETPNPITVSNTPTTTSSAPGTFPGTGLAEQNIELLLVLLASLMLLASAALLRRKKITQ